MMNVERLHEQVRKLPPGWRVRPPTPDDLPAMYDVVVACDLAQFGEPDMSYENFLADVKGVQNLARDAWVVTDETGRIVGSLLLSVPDEKDDLWGDGYVRPDVLGHGVGSALVQAAEARAREVAREADADREVTLTLANSAEDERARRLFARHGFQPVRYFYRMRRDFGPDEAIEPPAFPEGVSVMRCAEPGEAGPAGPEPWEQPLGSLAGERREQVLDLMRKVYAVNLKAFQAHWGMHDRSFESWYAENGAQMYDPSLWFLALRGDEPVGMVMATWFNGNGWLKNLGVLPQWRGQGFGMALLLMTMREFQRRGATALALGGDSENATGATRLYERAGMRQTREFALFRKVLRPAPNGEAS